MNIIQTLEAEQAAKLSAVRGIPEFAPGDTVIVNVKVSEGERSRVQAYEGVCIARSGGGLQESFTVRKISYGEGVERVFPIHSPVIDLRLPPSPSRTVQTTPVDMRVPSGAETKSPGASARSRGTRYE